MWNYRVMKHRSKRKGCPVEIYYGLHEVYYKKNGEPEMCTQEPDIIGDTPFEIVEVLAMMIRDATKSHDRILDYDNPPWEKKKVKRSKEGGRK